MAGPLSGLRIIEFGGIGPAPFCGMMLADHGAEVIVVHRPGKAPERCDPLARSRSLVAADLKDGDDLARVRALVGSAHGLIEGFRPGVMERLGLGPEVLLPANPALVYGRMTGWGQHGPLSQAAGHDINYIALSGALHACGRAGEKPTPPANLVGDFGGGGLMLAFAMVAALLNVARGGRGQVIDCAMTDGSAALTAMIWGFRHSHGWRDERGVNLLDTGAPFYDTYQTADGGYIALGAIEPQFYRLLRESVDLADDPLFDRQMDAAGWPMQKQRLADLFLTKSRDEWCALMEGTNVCFAPVLSFADAPQHPHNVARETFGELDGVMQPMPTPRYSETACSRPTPPVDRSLWE